MLRTTTLAFSLLLCTYTVASTNSKHRCIHDTYVLGHNQVQLYTQAKQLYTSSGISSKDTLTHKIKILLDTSALESDTGFSCFSTGAVIDIDGDSYTCASGDILTNDKRHFLETVLLPAANDRLASIFKVAPINGNLHLSNAQRCGFQGGVEIPHKYTYDGVGIPFDIVVFVTSRPIAAPHVLAFGGQCQEDQHGRPVAGHLNFSPSRITTDPSSRDAQLGIILHELTHVMGFSYQKFSHFGGFTTIKDHARAQGKEELITVINTPRVVKWIRNHFGCDNLVGAPLEDGGGIGTHLSHWEKRAFMNEYMTGESTTNPVLSALTMSLFEDSGWYEIDYSTAEDLVWGQNEGCKFVQESCGNWPQTRGYYCTDEARPSCSFDLQSKGHCGVSKHSVALPPESQYFDNPLLGGPSELADYCPYSVANTDGWCFDISNGGVPSIVDNGETFCKDCRCFESSLVKSLPIGGDTRLACYQTTCVNTTQLKVRINRLWYDCPPGKAITVAGYGGSILCPEVWRKLAFGELTDCDKEAQVYALCADVPADIAWPTIHTITPDSGTPGARVTIYGTGFTNGTSVEIHSPCNDVFFVSPNVIVAVVPSPDNFENPAHILAEVVNVVVIDGEGRTAEALVAFTLHRSGAGLSTIVTIIEWVATNWLPCAAVLVAVVAGCTYWYRRYRINALAKKAYSMIPMELDSMEV